MGNTLKAPPIFHLLAWFQHRASLCTVCHKNPKVTAADGDNRYCSEDCANLDGEIQSIA